MPTQLDRALALLSCLESARAPEATKLLKGLLDEAQNPPPHGGADGSIPEEVYNGLRAVVQAWERFQECAARLKTVAT